MSTPNKSLPEVAKHTHFSMCSHPEYKRKHPLPTHWPPHPTLSAPAHPPLPIQPRSAGVSANRPQWVTAGREERWGCHEDRLETLETTLGKVNMIQSLYTKSLTCTHTITCCHCVLPDNRPPGTHTHAVAQGQWSTWWRQTSGIRAGQMTKPSEILHTSSARRESVCEVIAWLHPLLDHQQQSPAHCIYNEQHGEYRVWTSPSLLVISVTASWMGVTRVFPRSWVTDEPVLDEAFASKEPGK